MRATAQPHPCKASRLPIPWANTPRLVLAIHPWIMHAAPVWDHVKIQAPCQSHLPPRRHTGHLLLVLMRIVFQCAKQAIVAGSTVLIVAAGLLLIFATLTFAVLRVIDPPGSMLMLTKRIGGEPVVQQWIGLKDVSPNLIRAVIQAEDARFCRHTGIDVIELRAAIDRSKSGDIGAVRGASTISMQVVKNLLLWPGRSLVRKGLEFILTPVMEMIWSKRRILEVYLNIAEWGPGIYGVEAAARYNFKKSAKRLTVREATLLAAALPNPKLRRPARPNRTMRRKAGRLARAAKWKGLNLSCIRR